MIMSDAVDRQQREDPRHEVNAQELPADGRRQHGRGPEDEEQPREHRRRGRARRTGRGRSRGRSPRRPPPRRPGAPAARRGRRRSGRPARAARPATCSAVPASSGRRRPSASESGPSTSWPSARPTRVPVRVSWTAADVVSSSRVMVGSAGRYMSMVSGPRATKAPRTSAVRAPARGAAGARRCGGRGGRSWRAVTGVLSGLGGCRGADAGWNRSYAGDKAAATRAHSGVTVSFLEITGGRAGSSARGCRCRTAPHHSPAP